MSAYSEVEQAMMPDEEMGGRTTATRRPWIVKAVVATGLAMVLVASIGMTGQHATAAFTTDVLGLSASDVNVLVEQAKLAEQAERYADMVEFMKQVVKKSPGGLTDEQRNLLSVAYKNVVGARRSAWRTLRKIGEKRTDDDDDISKQYLEKIATELKAKCTEVLALLDEHLLLAATADDPNGVEAKVFYGKMKGDYYRYLVEVTTGDERDELTKKSEAAYLAAIKSAENLPSTHPIKLGLALNYSVFLHEIKGDGKKACDFAKKAFDDAIDDLDNVKEDSYKDSTLIMQLLRDNLHQWTDESDDTNGDH